MKLWISQYVLRDSVDKSVGKSVDKSDLGPSSGGYPQSRLGYPQLYPQGVNNFTTYPQGVDTLWITDGTVHSFSTGCG